MDDTGVAGEDLGDAVSSHGRSAAPSGLSQSSLSQAKPAATIAGSVYRSQGYAMVFGDSYERDADGAPVSEVWRFASEDSGSHGDGWLEVRIHEIVETEHSGALAVYYRQWFAPDGEPAWGKKPLRKVGALASLKSLLRRRKMRPCDSDASYAQDPEEGLGGEAVAARAEGIAQGPTS